MNSREISEIESRLSHGLEQSLSGAQMDYLLRSARRERAEHVAEGYAALMQKLTAFGAALRRMAEACTAARLRTELGAKSAASHL